MTYKDTMNKQVIDTHGPIQLTFEYELNGMAGAYMIGGWNVVSFLHGPARVYMPATGKTRYFNGVNSGEDAEQHARNVALAWWETITGKEKEATP